MLADEFGAGAREKFGHCAALGVLVRKLKDRRVFACHGVFPDLTNRDRVRSDHFSACFHKHSLTIGVYLELSVLQSEDK